MNSPFAQILQGNCSSFSFPEHAEITFQLTLIWVGFLAFRGVRFELRGGVKVPPV